VAAERGDTLLGRDETMTFQALYTSESQQEETQFEQLFWAMTDTGRHMMAGDLFMYCASNRRTLDVGLTDVNVADWYFGTAEHPDGTEHSLVFGVRIWYTAKEITDETHYLDGLMKVTFRSKFGKHPEYVEMSINT
jgi:hypothetical protein